MTKQKKRIRCPDDERTPAGALCAFLPASFIDSPATPSFL